MNAIKFIQDNGVEKAREVVEGAPDCSSAFNIVSGAIVYYQLCDNWWWFNSATKEYEMDYSKSMKFDLLDLKRLIESVDLVKRYGGIAEAKTLHQDEFWDERAFKILKQAIADYELLFCSGESK